MNVKQNKGFSLIELMVVVAIIGILATVAVPNFMRFQSKAKQSNAKVELSAIYTAEQAFFTEHNSYHTYLSYIGFVPDGCTGAAANGGCPAAGTRIYSSGFAANGIVATFGNVAPAANQMAISYPSNAPNSLNTAIANSVPPTAVAFTAGSSGVIRAGAGTDVWTITNQKVLTNNTPSL